MAWTSILGIALLLWVAYDLYAGSVWLHREFYRAQEPTAYWLLILLWTAVAVSCFYWQV
ncbi:hypothetical protein MED92_05928 [Oceanospirillum sp. MED92]|uniref:Uncharacterized protein n=1 Tax=Neptuniibacter caesariensis TaxID=207954 RepID=A0A7U8C6V9_NEPCE|nr:hypothetical protein MED92_05928 [Oceanospirillum sp. MED92] [Neptuniibacter caesariensis]